MVKELEIKTPAQVQRINRLASEQPYEVFLTNGTVMLDARSLLGLFTLIGQKAFVVAEDDVDPARFGKLVQHMA